MALFTIDDLEFLEHDEDNFFNRSGKKDRPSQSSINTILNYSRALSVRQSVQLKELRMILN